MTQAPALISSEEKVVVVEGEEGEEDIFSDRHVILLKLRDKWNLRRRRLQTTVKGNLCIKSLFYLSVVIQGALQGNITFLYFAVFLILLYMFGYESFIRYPLMSIEHQVNNDKNAIWMQKQSLCLSKGIKENEYIKTISSRRDSGKCIQENSGTILKKYRSFLVSLLVHLSRRFLFLITKKRV